jgi:hypothetical protein
MKIEVKMEFDEKTGQEIETKYFLNGEEISEEEYLALFGIDEYTQNNIDVMNTTSTDAILKKFEFDKAYKLGYSDALRDVSMIINNLSDKILMM